MKLSFLLTLLFSSFFFAQDHSNPVLAEVGRIIFNENESIEAYNISISGDSVYYYYHFGEVLPHTTALANVIKIEKYRGTKWVLMGISLGVLGTAIGAVLSSGVNQDLKGIHSSPASEYSPIYAYGLIGAVLGGFWGSTLESWTTVYKKK